MPGGSPKADPLFAKTWVHAFEEDNAAGAVYRVAGEAKLPLSRRPRERLQLEPNGSAIISAAGPDDRFVEKPGTWTEEEGAVVIRASGGGSGFRIIERSSSRLLVRSQKTESD